MADYPAPADAEEGLSCAVSIRQAAGSLAVPDKRASTTLDWRAGYRRLTFRGYLSTAG
jgi:hypothetical protein